MLFIDLETYCDLDLKKVGVYKYTEHPSFLILMASYAYNDEPIQTAIGHAEIASIDGLWTDFKVAHNAQFERVSLTRLGRGLLELEAEEWMDPSQWDDTMALAGEYGLPQSLDLCAKALNCTPKDTAGSALIRLFCMPNKEGKRNMPEDFPEKWLEFIAYCEQDVGTLREIYAKVGEWPSGERDMWITDQHINDNGILVDRALAYEASTASSVNSLAQREEFTSLTGVDNPGSHPQVMGWAQAEGLSLRNLQAETVASLLASGTLAPHQHRALELRADLALTSSSKYATALTQICKDDRVRGQLAFFGAHTGRWAGRGIQLHNLPRHSFKLLVDEMLAIYDLMEGQGATPDDLKRLVRAMFLGPFTTVDYASIEARVVAWLANEVWALQAFRDGRDIYVETAERMGGLTRPQGKIAVLALGYNGGVNSLKALAGDAAALQKLANPEGGDWLPPPEIDKRLWNMVQVWRKANARIANLWTEMADAIEDGGRVGPHMRITRKGRTMQLWLPSGRAIHYHGVRWEKRTFPTEYIRPDGTVGVKNVTREAWFYDDPKSPKRIGTYGGRMVENATQAIARDIMAEALVRLDKAGYKTALHVHDEIVIEGKHDVEEVAAIMCEQPAWATGLPINAEGFNSERYRKG